MAHFFADSSYAYTFFKLSSEILRFSCDVADDETRCYLGRLPIIADAFKRQHLFDILSHHDLLLDNALYLSVPGPLLTYPYTSTYSQVFTYPGPADQAVFNSK